MRATKKQDIALYYKKTLKVIKTHDSVATYNEKHHKKLSKANTTPPRGVLDLGVV